MSAGLTVDLFFALLLAIASFRRLNRSSAFMKWTKTTPADRPALVEDLDSTIAGFHVLAAMMVICALAAKHEPLTAVLFLLNAVTAALMSLDTKVIYTDFSTRLIASEQSK